MRETGYEQIGTGLPGRDIGGDAGKDMAKQGALTVIIAEMENELDCYKKIEARLQRVASKLMGEGPLKNGDPIQMEQSLAKKEPVNGLVSAVSIRIKNLQKIRSRIDGAVMILEQL